MNRQDSTTDQLASVATEAEAYGNLPLANWLRDGPPPASREDYWRGRKLARAIGCYDAEDWMERNMPPVTGGGGG